jgi:hypothetical protein
MYRGDAGLLLAQSVYGLITPTGAKGVGGGGGVGGEERERTDKERGNTSYEYMHIQTTDTKLGAPTGGLRRRGCPSRLPNVTPLNSDTIIVLQHGDTHHSPAERCKEGVRVGRVPRHPR